MLMNVHKSKRTQDHKKTKYAWVQTQMTLKQVYICSVSSVLTFVMVV